MKPTAGRIVLYTPMAGEFTGNDTSPVPAIITRVWSDECVNLKVFSDGPSDYWVTSVLLGEGYRTWAWPPRA